MKSIGRDIGSLIVGFLGFITWPDIIDPIVNSYKFVKLHYIAFGIAAILLLWFFERCRVIRYDQTHDYRDRYKS